MNLLLFFLLLLPCVIAEPSLLPLPPGRPGQVLGQPQSQASGQGGLGAWDVLYLQREEEQG